MRRPDLLSKNRIGAPLLTTPHHRGHKGTDYLNTFFDKKCTVYRVLCVPLPVIIKRCRRPYIRAADKRTGETKAEPAPVDTVTQSVAPDRRTLSCTVKRSVSVPERESTTM